jgi:nucleotide-binding universal stress UspA family protein
MGATTHILLTTDFSEASQEAVEKAAELARTTDAKLTVLHIHRHAPAAPEAVIPTDKQITSADLDIEASQGLDELKRTILSDVENVTLVTLENASAPLAICDYADRNGVDLIVIGTHGRTGMPRLLIGSVAEKVVRHANCPILVVPHAKRLSRT